MKAKKTIILTVGTFLTALALILAIVVTDRLNNPSTIANKDVTDNGSDADHGVNTYVDADPDAYPDADTVAYSDADTNAYSDADADADAYSDANAASDADTDAASDADAYPDADANTADTSDAADIPPVSGDPSAPAQPPVPDDDATTEVQETPGHVDDDTVRIIAIGDNLIHQRIMDEGLLPDGTRNYDFLYEHIRDYIADAEVKIINQETLIVTEEFGYSGYPFFGTPKEVGDAVIEAGFNVATLATNHTFDKGDPATYATAKTEAERTGPQGLLCALEYWKEHSDSIAVTGAYADRESYDTLTVQEYDGIKIAFLNYTYMINFQDTREQIDYAKQYVKYLDEELYLDEIRRARELADVVIVLPHWGVEYDPLPSYSQKRMAQQMADAGADIIIGTHPHVVQPLVTIHAADGRDVPCFYSLGNYVSNMTTTARQLELMAEVTLKKTEEGVTITDVKATPLVNHIYGDDDHFAVYLLSEYTDELAAEHYYNPELEKSVPLTTEALWGQYYAEVFP